MTPTKDGLHLNGTDMATLKAAIGAAIETFEKDAKKAETGQMRLTSVANQFRRQAGLMKDLLGIIEPYAQAEIKEIG